MNRGIISENYVLRQNNYDVVVSIALHLCIIIPSKYSSGDYTVLARVTALSHPFHMTMLNPGLLEGIKFWNLLYLYIISKVSFLTHQL